MPNQVVSNRTSAANGNAVMPLKMRPSMNALRTMRYLTMWAISEVDSLLDAACSPSFAALPVQACHRRGMPAWAEVLGRDFETRPEPAEAASSKPRSAESPPASFDDIQAMPQKL